MTAGEARSSRRCGAPWSPPSLHPRGSRGMKIVLEVQLTTLRCATCGIDYAVPQHLLDRCNTDPEMVKRGWWCPNGHKQIWSTPEIDRLRRERDNLKQQEARLIEERTAAYRLL